MRTAMFLVFLMLNGGSIVAETNTVSALEDLVLTSGDIRHVNGDVVSQNAWHWNKTIIKDGKKISPFVRGITQELKHGSSTLLFEYCLFESSDVAYLSAKEASEGLSIRAYPGVWTNAYGLKMVGSHSWYTFIPGLKQSGLIFHYKNLYVLAGNIGFGIEAEEPKRIILTLSQAIITKYDMAVPKAKDSTIKDTNSSGMVLSLERLTLTTNDLQKLDISVITRRESSLNRARSLDTVYGISQTISCRLGEFRLHYGYFDSKEDAYISAKEHPFISIGPGIWTNSPSLKKVGDCTWYVLQEPTHLVLFQKDKLCVTINADGVKRTPEVKMKGAMDIADAIVKKYDTFMRTNRETVKDERTVP
jgi:hypothetical protein